MSWQQPNMSGGPSGVDGGAPPATEYTLQGVMRFLQLEWHAHERARNAWDIERAEMKAKIAKQEGDVRSARKLNDQLERQIRMLEMALRNERSKKKAASGEEKPAGEEEDKAKGASKTETGFKKPKAMNNHHNSFLDIDPESRDQSEAERENQRDKTRIFMTRCVEEITYLLQPPAHPPPPQQNMSLAHAGNFLNQQEAPLGLEELYLQNQRQKGQHQQPGTVFAHPSTMPNHQPPPIPSMPDMPGLTHTSHPGQQATLMTRESSNQPFPQSTGGPVLELQNHQIALPQSDYAPAPDEEPVEKVQHRYDVFGRPMPPTREGEPPPTGQIVSEDAGGWTFDESMPSLDATGEAPAPRRPDIDAFPSANLIPAKSPPRTQGHGHRRKSSSSSGMARRRSEGQESRELAGPGTRLDHQGWNFRVRFSMRGHMDVVRTVIFTGGGSPSEPEICTAGDDGLIKRWIIPAGYVNMHASNNDPDISSYFTHRGHEGVVTSLAACPAAANFATGGRVSGDGWIFSAGHDATVRVWERGRVDPKAVLDSHTEAVLSVCVLPTTCAAVFGQDCNKYGGPDRILLASGSQDGTVKIWAVSAPPQIVSPSTGSRRGVGGSRRHSVTSGSNFPSSPQPSVATDTPFDYVLVHTIERTGTSVDVTTPWPTCITPLAGNGNNFVVSYSDSSVVIFNSKTGEEVVSMASGETYDGTPATQVNSVVASSLGNETSDTGRTIPEDETVHGATGSLSEGGVEGIVISGHEDRYIRFFDANSGQCTYNMLAHPSPITSLSMSKDGREIVSAGHDASIRFWSLEKRVVTQEITAHRITHGEGVRSVVWSQDGRLVVSAGGDGVVNVLAR